MSKQKRNKYPPHPGSGRDYAVIETARQALQKPNKVICIYCHAQAAVEQDLSHESDCLEGRAQAKKNTNTSELAHLKDDGPETNETRRYQIVNETATCSKCLSKFKTSLLSEINDPRRVCPDCRAGEINLPCDGLHWNSRLGHIAYLATELLKKEPPVDTASCDDASMARTMLVQVTETLRTITRMLDRKGGGQC